MTDLPVLEEDRIDAMESALFADIARERREISARTAAERARGRRRRRTAWLASGAAAAVLVVAVAIAPQLTGSSAGSGAVAPAAEPGLTFDAPADGDGRIFSESSGGFATEESVPAPAARDLDGAGSERGDGAAREVVASASATIVVDDPRAAADEIGALAAAAGGYVESASVGGASPTSSTDTAIWPPVSGGAWVSVRVPADVLSEVLDDLGEVGDIETSQVSRDDVTSQAIDLRARVQSGQASVDRLTGLLAEAGSVADLIAAESALAERQADLEALQQQLAALDSQVAMSSLTVQLTTPPATVDADPAGFGDGLTAGINGLVATLNGVIVAIGFLLPWLGVLAVVAFVMWLIARTTRRRRASRAAPDET
ncbi:DUF4349 domain-containing protein [Microbacterium radiodurans]|uniref:DUF4349 domain-containing protein n=1 Tax=Microbacterium radiodurans TaxID=661398 RepID=A0A5J5ISR5_9MICO|nr:DUF4349 domain-containing protein [Microbacterium radiodurans]KAA9086928.1 DUF4349 domain-containing protein [Microbacterium radiodurans]